MGFPLSWMSCGIRAGSFVPYFSPVVKQSPLKAEGFLGAVLMLWPQAAVEAGTFFGVLFPGTEFAPSLLEAELKNRLIGFSGQEYPWKQWCWCYFWVSALLCMLSAVFWWGFAFSPKRESCGWYSWMMPKSTASNLKHRFVSLCSLGTTALPFRRKH